MIKLYPSHLRVVVLLLSVICRSCPLALLPGNSLCGIFSQLPSTQPLLCPLWSPLLLAALTPLLGSGDLSCLLLLLKMKFAFLFPILLVAFGCSPAGKGGYANCMEHIQTTSAPLHFYTSISSTVKDPEIKVTRPLTRMANKMIIKFFMNNLLLLRE